MPLYEIVKCDGTREKVDVQECHHVPTDEGTVLRLLNDPQGEPVAVYPPGTWLEVWRREGVGE